MSQMRTVRNSLPLIAVGLVAVGTAVWFLGIRTAALGRFSFGKQRLLRNAKLAVREVLPEFDPANLRLRGGQIVVTGTVNKQESKMILKAIYGVPEIREVVDALQISETSAGSLSTKSV